MKRRRDEGQADRGLGPEEGKEHGEEVEAAFFGQLGGWGPV